MRFSTFSRRVLPRAGKALLFSVLLLFSAGQARAWEWTVIPYLWASDITMDVAVNGNEAIGTDVAFSDLVDKLDGAFSFHFEGRQGEAGFWIDLTLIALSDSTTTTGQGAPLFPPDTKVATDLDLTIFEAAGFIRLSGEERRGFDLIGGLRYIGMDQGIGITLPAPPAPMIDTGTDTSFLDGFLGFRYAGPLGERWSWRIRGDYGFGDTDGTANGVLGVAYNWGNAQKYGLILAYQYMGIELEEKTGDGLIETDLTMSGPKLGFRITWGG